jgi:cytoskeletal protein RodZ
VRPDPTNVDAGVAKTEVDDAAAPEAGKIAPSLARLEADLAAAEAKSRVMERLTYWAVGGLIVLAMIALPLLLAMRKRARAAKGQSSGPEIKPVSSALQSQATQAQSIPFKSEPEKPSTGTIAAVSRDAVLSRDAAATVASATGLQGRNEKKQAVITQSKSEMQEKPVAATNGKSIETAPPASAATISCVECNGEISANDKFCMHCGAAVASRAAAATTRLCSSCRQEIGAADRFCRHCGASSMAVAAPSMMLSGIGA